MTAAAEMPGKPLTTRVATLWRRWSSRSTEVPRSPTRPASGGWAGWSPRPSAAGTRWWRSYRRWVKRPTAWSSSRIRSRRRRLPASSTCW